MLGSIWTSTAELFMDMAAVVAGFIDEVTCIIL